MAMDTITRSIARIVRPPIISCAPKENAAKGRCQSAIPCDPDSLLDRRLW